MNRLRVTYFALVALLSAASCTKEAVEPEAYDWTKGEIYFRTSLADVAGTRAMDMTLDKLESFQVTCFNMGDRKHDETGGIFPYFEDATFIRQSNPVGVTYISSPEEGPRDWPEKSGVLKFFTFFPSRDVMIAHNAALEDKDKSDYFNLINKSKETDSEPYIGYQLGTVRINPDISGQFDFVTASASGERWKDFNNGIELEFKHRMCRVELRAWGANNNYDFEIAGVRLGNPTVEGVFNFTPDSETDGFWEISADAAKDKVEYIFQGNNAQGSEEVTRSEDETPSEDEIPTEDENPAEDETPSEDEIPTEDENPAEDETPSEDEIPTEDENPAEDDNPFEDTAIGDRIYYINSTTHNTPESAESIMGNGGPAMVLPSVNAKWEGMADPNIATMPYSTDKMYFSVLLRVVSPRNGNKLYPYSGHPDNMMVVYLAVDKVGKIISRLYPGEEPDTFFKDEQKQQQYTPAEGEEIKDFGWAAVPIDIDWEAGKSYVYTLNYSEGVGIHDPQDPEPGKPIGVAGSPITWGVKVEQWEIAEEGEPDYTPDIVVPKLN